MDDFLDIDFGKNEHEGRIPMVTQNLQKYHESIVQEIRSLKNRVQYLIGRSHLGTVGEHKEAVLRNVLRAHMPETVRVGRGFIVQERKNSTQIDILIVDRQSPTLFKDGDLMIITPDVVRAIIEVKTRLEGPQKIQKALNKLATIASFANGQSRCYPCWAGLFVYEGEPDHKTVLEAIGKARNETGGIINCTSWGDSTFVRFWTNGHRVNSPCDGEVWHSYCLKDLAQAYFIGNAVAAISGQVTAENEFAWFPLEGGKETRRKFYLPIGELEVRSF